MTFKELLSEVTFADVAPYIEQSVRDNENDKRPFETKYEEVEKIFEQVKGLKPTFGHIISPIEVKMLGGKLRASNMHLGSMSDVLSHQVVIAPNVTATPTETAAECVYQLAAYQAATERYRDGEEFDDLDPLMARIVR
jgi:hypothetical protein